VHAISVKVVSAKKVPSVLQRKEELAEGEKETSFGGLDCGTGQIRGSKDRRTCTPRWSDVPSKREGARPKGKEKKGGHLRSPNCEKIPCCKGANASATGCSNLEAATREHIGRDPIKQDWIRSPSKSKAVSECVKESRCR